MSKLTETIHQLVEPVINNMGYELVEVQYGKEGGRYILRIFIDQPCGISLDDCDKVSRAIDLILDKEDPISHSYYLEVSSPGLERPLKKEADFKRFAGRKIKLRTYTPLNGQRNFTGKLVGCDKEEIEIICDDKTFKLPLAQVANARLVFDPSENEED